MSASRSYQPRVPQTGKCHRCGGKHHVSICSKGTDSPAGSSEQTRASTSSATIELPTSNVNPSHAEPAPMQRSMLNAAAPTFQSQDPCSTTSLWVSSDRVVLLQTAQAFAINPSSPQKSPQVRIVLDSGSQRSYITEQVTRELHWCQRENSLSRS